MYGNVLKEVFSETKSQCMKESSKDVFSVTKSQCVKTSWKDVFSGTESQCNVAIKTSWNDVFFETKSQCVKTTESLYHHAFEMRCNKRSSKIILEKENVKPVQHLTFIGQVWLVKLLIFLLAWKSQKGMIPHEIRQLPGRKWEIIFVT